MLCCDNEPITHVWAPLIPNRTSVYAAHLNSSDSSRHMPLGLCTYGSRDDQGLEKGSPSSGCEAVQTTTPEDLVANSKDLERAQPRSLLSRPLLVIFLKRSLGAAALVEGPRGCCLGVLLFCHLLKLRGTQGLSPSPHVLAAIRGCIGFMRKITSTCFYGTTHQATYTKKLTPCTIRVVCSLCALCSRVYMHTAHPGRASAHTMCSCACALAAHKQMCVHGRTGLILRGPSPVFEHRSSLMVPKHEDG